MNKLYGVVIGLVCVVSIGCSESSSVTVHEPGVYKGASDPLLSANSEERANELSARFNLGQIDR